MKFVRRLLRQVPEAHGYLAATVVTGVVIGSLVVVQANYLSRIISSVFLAAQAWSQLRHLMLVLPGVILLGDISLGGRSLKSFPQQDITRSFSVVEQHARARQALIHDFISSLPQGYATLIGEQGLRLSGGERQRLSLARAILKDAPLLLLDEPTAHLDAVTEAGILHNLREFMRRRTTIMITHRLVGLEAADEILVMLEGEIKERGAHHELMQAEGLYWKLWKLQNQMVMTEL